MIFTGESELPTQFDDINHMASRMFYDFHTNLLKKVIEVKHLREILHCLSWPFLIHQDEDISVVHVTEQTVTV